MRLVANSWCLSPERGHLHGPRPASRAARVAVRAAPRGAAAKGPDLSVHRGPPFYRCFAVIVTPLTKMQVRGEWKGMQCVLATEEWRLFLISLAVVQLRMPPLPGILNELLSNPLL